VTQLWSRMILLMLVAPLALAAPQDFGTIDTDFFVGDGGVSGEVSFSSQQIVCNEAEIGNTGMCVTDKTCGAIQNTENLGKCSAKDVKSGKEMTCCKKNVYCGESASAFITYFNNPNWPATDNVDRSCNIKILVRPGVCQVRLDFLTFELPGPRKGGVCQHQNRMSFLAPGRPLGILGGRSNQGICGLNSGQHLYIQTSFGEQIQILTTLSGTKAVPLGDAPLSYASATEYRWNIKITQIQCEGNTGGYKASKKGMDSIPEYFHHLRAPDGCLQYFMNSFDTISSWNFDGSSTFPPDQDYAICIRNRGNSPSGRTCAVTFRATSFGLPVNGNDRTYCSNGGEFVNPESERDCCLNPHSSYVGVTAVQPGNHKGYTAWKRYWCGASLGSFNQVIATQEPYIVKVYSGRYTVDDLWAEPALEQKARTGFQIDYKVDTGAC